MKNSSTKIAIGIICLGTILLVLGVNRGEVAVILEKAIRICLGCIGIG